MLAFCPHHPTQHTHTHKHTYTHPSSLHPKLSPSGRQSDRPPTLPAGEAASHCTLAASPLVYTIRLTDNSIPEAQHSTSHTVKNQKVSMEETDEQSRPTA